MKLIPTPHDDAVTTLANYRVIPFSSEYGSAGYALRVIEIYQFHQLQPLFQQFETLTGYQAPAIDFTHDEAALLIKAGLAVCHEEAQKRAGYKQSIDDLKQQLNDMKQGATQATHAIADAKYHLTRLTESLDREENYQARQEEFISQMYGLLNLLRSPILALQDRPGQPLNDNLVTQLPPDSWPVSTYCEGHLNLSPCEFMGREITDLKAAMQRIISKCTPPKDRYLLNQGADIRTQFYCEYYSLNGEAVRTTMTADQFVELAEQKMQRMKQKQRVMRASLKH